MKKGYPVISKITRPRISGVFPRERLFRLLDDTKEAPVIWVSGPAGSGKTTLVGSYLDSRRLPCLWYQLDVGDSDLATFFYYMGLAAKKAAPRTRKPLPLLTPEYLLDVPTFARRFFESLCSRLKPPFYLVFDNYQEVPPQGSPFHDILRAGLSRVPEGIQVIVISRSDHPPAFTGMLADNRMNVIGWDEIKFTPDESNGIICLHVKERQDKETISWVYEKTQGWAAGLVLLAKAAKAETIELTSLKTLAPEKVFDYFANELFDKRTDETTRDFLLKTAVLPKITPSVAERLTGNKDAGMILAELYHRNYFTEKRQHPELTYQYHPLFREFLLSRATNALLPAALTELHLTAGHLLQDAGQIEDAAELFINSISWTELVKLILDHAQAMLTQGRHGTLRAWIDNLPQAMIESRPYLLYWRASSLMPFNPTESRKSFQKAFTLFKRESDRFGMFIAWSAASDIALHEASDFSYLDDQIDLLNKMLADDPSFPSPEIKERVIMSIFNALALRQPWNAEKNSWEEQAFNLLQKGRDKNMRIHTGFFLTFYHLYMGNMAKSARVMSLLREEIRSGEISPLMIITGKTIQTLHGVLAGDFVSSRQANAEALRIAQETGVHIWDNHILGHGCAAALSLGDLPLAEEFLDRMKSLRPLSRRLDIAYYHFLSTWHALLTHRTDKALEQINLVGPLIITVGFRFAEYLYYIILAQVHHERADHEKASKYLAIANEMAHKIGSNLFKWMTLLIDAYMSFDRAEVSREEKTGNKLSRHGMDCLRKALVIGREQGIRNILGWRSDVMAKLSAKALDAGIETEYVRELIRKRNLNPPDAISECGAQNAESNSKSAIRNLNLENWPWPIKIYTLGRFRVMRDDKPLSFSGRVHGKPLEMLKALIAFGGKDVREEQIVDALWPEAEGHVGHTSFKTTLHRLRQILGREDAIQVQEGRATLDPRCFWVDAWAFERMLESAELGVQSSEYGMRKIRNSKSAIHNPKSEILQRFEKALQLYQGHFLSGEESMPWVVSMQERLKEKFLRAVELLGSFWEQRREHKKAVECYQRGLDIDDLAEGLYQRLMQCYLRLGRRAEAMKAYERCRKTLSAVLGVGPSEETGVLYTKIVGKG